MNVHMAGWVMEDMWWLIFIAIIPITVWLRRALDKFDDRK
jgi:hypothetical protein